MEFNQVIEDCFACDILAAELHFTEEKIENMDPQVQDQAQFENCEKEEILSALAKIERAYKPLEKDMWFSVLYRNGQGEEEINQRRRRFLPGFRETPEANQESYDGWTRKKVLVKRGVPGFLWRDVCTEVFISDAPLRSFGNNFLME